MRAALVNTTALALIAKDLEVGPFIKLGRGEISSGGAERPSILADVMEALIGAVYWDSSYETAMEIIERLFGDRFTPAERKSISAEKEEEYRKIFLPQLKLIEGLADRLNELTAREVPMAVGTAAPPKNVSFVVDNLEEDRGNRKHEPW